MATSGHRMTSSLSTLPKFGQDDVVRLVKDHSKVKGSKLDKGYKLFFEQFVFNYKAGKALCNHVVALLFQTAHYSTMGVKTVPTALSCTSALQTWHRPRTKGIRPEPMDEVVVRKPKAAGRSCVKSTLYQAYPGPFPDPALLSVGDKLRDLRPQLGICSILCGLSSMELVESKFGQVPKGSVLSYQCPTAVSHEICKHPEAPSFPKLPLHGYRLDRHMNYVPSFEEYYHIESLMVTSELSCIIEKNTREQSENPLWKELRQPRLTSSRFGEVYSARGDSSSEALAVRMLRGVRQTSAMKRGIELEPEVLQLYSDFCGVNVSPSGFVIHPDAPYLGTSPDAKVYDPSEKPPFGLAEVKCPNVNSIAEATHIKFTNGQAKLKRNHKYFWQVLGQLAITGLPWCDFITSTKSDLTVERIWKDESLINDLKKKLDIFYFNTYMQTYLKNQ